MFHLQGGITYSKLGKFDNFIMMMMEKMIKKMEVLSPEYKKLADVIGNDFDFSERETIRPIIEYMGHL